jgi:hypothetical protein
MNYEFQAPIFELTRGVLKKAAKCENENLQLPASRHLSFLLILFKLRIHFKN